MKRIWSFFVSAGLALAISTATVAQSAGPKTGATAKTGQQRGMNQARMKQMAEARKEVFAKLALTKDQQAKIKALDAKTEKSLKDLIAKARAGGKKPGPEVREKVQAIRKSHRDAVDKILSASQRAKYRDLMKAKREEMRKKRGSKPTK
jgi:Spy/CpxP family protein refolding chaperone